MSSEKKTKTEDVKSSLSPTGRKTPKTPRTPGTPGPSGFVPLTYHVVANPGKKHYQQDMPIIVPSMKVVNSDLKETRQENWGFKHLIA